MGIFKNIADWLILPPIEGFEQKNYNINSQTVPQHSPDDVLRMLAEDTASGGTLATAVSAVHACARVISEGLALPPCYVHKEGQGGKTLATRHPLYYLLNKSPNTRQTSYEFREMIGWNLALHSNAYIFINRSQRDGSILELLPCDYGAVSVSVDESRLFGPIQYYIYGQAVPSDNIWHIKGPSSVSYQGQSLSVAARRAISLASNTERFGSNLFINGAKPGGLIAPKSGDTLTPEQVEQIKSMWSAQSQGVGNAHKTVLLTAGLEYTPMSSTANDAQWIETRRFQIEEICRFFRVSPTKVFNSDGSQSYASVEQAHIAHDQDTDAHWAERFVQSANKALLTDKDRRDGYTITLDNRSILRGTAGERMAYYTAGKAAGLITTNEIREMEGFDRSDDPDADKLISAQNIFGAPATPDGPSADETPKNNG